MSDFNVIKGELAILIGRALAEEAKQEFLSRIQVAQTSKALLSVVQVLQRDGNASQLKERLKEFEASLRMLLDSDVSPKESLQPKPSSPNQSTAVHAPDKIESSKQSSQGKRKKTSNDPYPTASPLARLLCQVLSDDRKLFNFFHAYAFPDETKVSIVQLVDFLTSTTPETRVGYEFPLARLRSILELAKDRRDFDLTDSRGNLKEIAEILWMFSCPREDFEGIKTGMRTIMDSGGSSSMPEVTCRTEPDIQDWTRAVRLQLLDEQFKKWESQHRLVGYSAGELRQAFLESRLRFISCGGLPPSNVKLEEWFAGQFLKDLNIEMENMEGVPATAVFNEELRRAVDGELKKFFVMFISDDRSNTYKALKEAFPMLFIIKLPEKNSVQYARICVAWQKTQELINAN